MLRSHLDRELDDAWNLKWVYPELFTGKDLLRALLESNKDDNKARRVNAIESFLIGQYDADRYSTFKEIALERGLLDIFTDVPLELLTPAQDESSTSKLRKHYPNWPIVDLREKNSIFHGENSIFGHAAESFLDGNFQSRFSKCLLEGAPGQGKSTVTQYVCQIHRIAILGLADDYPLLTNAQRVISARIPIRIIVRDYAAWLNRINPFQPGSDLHPDWNGSVESFISALIKAHSGGIDFSVHDLHEVLRESAVLLIFDGLDEVGDVTAREQTIKELNRAIVRLEKVCPSLQVIVTTRPPAFSNSPTIMSEKFSRFQLAKLKLPDIQRYAERWLATRKIGEEEAKSIVAILNKKLALPHVLEIATNPMQLAILLNLIFTRGQSLPEQRTELYDSYVSLFFDREADKNSLVRDNRKLLLNLHCYLGWHLHSKAEEERDNGLISIDDLQKTIREYLDKQSIQNVKVQELFSGLVERIVILVSRLEGTFEFEVQPLREYFAARHLYNTAPIRRSSSEIYDDRPARFEALAANHYWLNVIKFYAGCYNTGEIPSLVDCIIELENHSIWKNSTHARMLATTIISDLIFSENSHSLKRLLKFLLDPEKLRTCLQDTTVRWKPTSTLMLPDGCGRKELAELAFKMIHTVANVEQKRELVSLIKSNTNKEERETYWLDQAKNSTLDPVSVCKLGLAIEVLHSISCIDIRDVMQQHFTRKEEAMWIVSAARADYIEIFEELIPSAFEAILQMALPMPARQDSNPLFRIWQLHDPDLLFRATKYSGVLPLSEVWKFGTHASETQEIAGPTQFDILPSFREFQNCLETLFPTSMIEWETSPLPWDKIVEASRQSFGERCIHLPLAICASTIPEDEAWYANAKNLFDTNESLLKRIYFARAKGNTPTWWSEQFKNANSLYEKILVVISLFLVATGNSITRLANECDQLISQLTEAEWKILYRVYNITLSSLQRANRERSVSKQIQNLPEALSERLIILVGKRCKRAFLNELLRRRFISYNGSNVQLQTFLQSMYVHALRRQTPDELEESVEKIAEYYQNGALSPYIETKTYYPFLPLSLKAAKRIIQKPNKYPRFLINQADSTIRSNAKGEVRPLAAIARDQNWFSQLV